MNLLKITLLCFVMIISSCNSSSRSVNPQININKTDPNRACIPQDELLAGNIIGGQLVEENDVDAKNVLMLISDGKLCTATAIRKNVILTAAHCIAGGVNLTYAIFRSSVSCESGFNKFEHRQKVSRIYVHEDYDSKASAETMTADVALVFLETEVPKGQQIFDIVDPDLVNDQDEMYFYGYGRIRSGQDSAAGAGMLRKVVLPGSTRTIDKFNKKVKVNQSNGEGICQGDSGGPSFVTIGGQKMILGINSYVRGPESDICSQESYQTLAYSYSAWINSKIDPFGK